VLRFLFDIYGIEQVKLAVIDKLYNQFAEQSVLPGEPRSGEIVRVIHIERLVHEAGAGISSHNHLDAPLNFSILL
jgi:hypothetical protein